MACAVLRKVVVSFHVAGQISWRLVVFAYFSVSQAEKAIPLLLVFTGTALVFSIFLHQKSGWVISVVFTFPLWFLAWDTQSAHKSDLFGWKHSSATVCTRSGPSVAVPVCLAPFMHVCHACMYQ